MNQPALLFALGLGLTGCLSSTSDDAPECTGGKCDGNGVDQSCADPAYGNGTCDLHISCAVPDIDCFQTFANDVEAGNYWAATSKAVLNEDYAIIPQSDPRFVRVRKQLDKGWAAFKSHRPVGKLADQTPALVLVDRPLINAAFVFGDRIHNKQPFVVMVETPALELGADDDAVLAVMMHELEHAVGLQKLGDVEAKTRKFYFAPPGTEPMGRDQTDDGDARTVAEAWMEAASQIGPYAQSELAGLPMAGEFGQMLATVASSAMQAHPTECGPVLARIDQINSALVGSFDPNDGSLPADLTGVEDAIDNAMITLRDGCLANFPYGVIEVGAQMTMQTPAQVEAQMEPRDVALVKGVSFVDGLDAIVRDRRETMRTAEDLVLEGTGAPWAQVRYFSIEEDADDVSGIVMHAAGLDPTSGSKFFRAMLSANARTACDAALAKGLPPYGVDLTDAHHATCWRIGHNQRQALTFRAKPVMPHPHLRPLTKPGTFPVRFDPHSQIAD